MKNGYDDTKQNLNKWMIKGLYSQKSQYCQKCHKPIVIGELSIKKFISKNYEWYLHLNCLEFEKYMPEANL